MNSNDSTHQTVWTLLPWYANGTLSAEENAQVRAHLDQCPRCRSEVALQQEVMQRSPQGSEVWAPSPAHFASLMQSIDQQSTAVAAPPSSPSWLEHWQRWWQETPSLIRRAFVLETAFAGLLAIILVAQQQTESSSAYRTMTSPTPVVTVKLPRIRLVFGDGASERDVRTLITTINGSIVQGPSSIGVYTIEVKDLDQSIKLARAQSTVRLAEPVTEAP